MSRAKTRIGNRIMAVRIKKLKPTDRGYLLRDEKKVLVNEKKGIVIGKGADSLWWFCKKLNLDYKFEA